MAGTQASYEGGVMEKKATIDEIEKILNEVGSSLIEILPNGEVKVLTQERAKELQQELADLRGQHLSLQDNFDSAMEYESKRYLDLKARHNELLGLVRKLRTIAREHDWFRSADYAEIDTKLEQFMGKEA
jgi:hypothetical protein